MSLVERSFRTAYAALFLVFVLFGATVTVIGAALPRILADFGWSYGSAGLVMAMGSVGSFATSWLVGRLVGRIGARATLLAGMGLSTLGLAPFALIPSVALNTFLYFLVGAGQGFLETGVNWSVLRMDRGGSGRAMSLMHGAFALGAVLGPLATGALLGAGAPVVLIYRGAAIASLLLGILLALLPLGRLGRDAATGRGGKKTAASEGVAAAEGGAADEAAPAATAGTGAPRPGHGAIAWLGALALFLYVGAEIGVSNWAAELFVRALGSSLGFGALAVSLFWAGLLAGRFGIPVFLPRVRQESLILVLSSGFALAVGLLALTGFLGAGTVARGLGTGTVTVGVAAALVLLAGLGASGIYPAAMSLIGGAARETPGPAIGFAATGGGVGAFLFPFAMSGIATAWGVLAGFGFYALTAIAGAFAAHALVRRCRDAARRL